MHGPVISKQELLCLDGPPDSAYYIPQHNNASADSQDYSISYWPCFNCILWEQLAGLETMGCLLAMNCYKVIDILI